jgi:Fe-S-cluster containining protein
MNYPHVISSPELKKAENKLANFLSSWLEDWRKISPDGAMSLIWVKNNLIEILNRCQVYHQLSEDYLAKVFWSKENNIQCKKGCGSCCHHYPESLESFELLYLYSKTRERDDFFEILTSCLAKVTLYQKIKDPLPKEFKSLKEEEDAEDVVLYEYYKKQDPCPFLTKAGECSTHQSRPNTCRMFLSLSEAKYCTPEFLIEDVNKNFLAFFPDSIEESVYELGCFLDVIGLSDSMYEGILQLNALESNIEWNPLTH